MSTRPDLLRKYSDLLESSETEVEEGVLDFLKHPLNTQARNASSAQRGQNEKIKNTADTAFTKWNQKAASINHTGTPPTPEQFEQWVQKYFKLTVPVDQMNLNLDDPKSVYKAITQMAGHYYAGTTPAPAPGGTTPAAGGTTPAAAGGTPPAAAAGGTPPATAFNPADLTSAINTALNDPNLKWNRELKAAVKNLWVRMGGIKAESKTTNRKMVT